MESGFRVDHDDVVEVGGHAVGIRDDLIHIRTNQSGVALQPCVPTSHPQIRVAVQKTAREVVSLSMVVWWNENMRSTRENMPPFPRQSSNCNRGPYQRGEWRELSRGAAAALIIL